MKFKTKTIQIPLCEICETELEPQNPYCKLDDGYYCGECAFKAGKITKEEYIKTFLYYVPFGSIKDVIIKNDKIMVI